ncbi:hypothetical protein LUZ63_011604 [Rhynchospora breviuscula]|uniref:Protein FAR1-RELATED SEQUENCE n=1 Tax=Rhynchospora breviuscula TaxID=2022672 RepID=A0A9Q0CJ60_9POAL|nr:hypothetical protein LUZ63_011604 [Rhynchospora breviuscula]
MVAKGEVAASYSIGEDLSFETSPETSDESKQSVFNEVAADPTENSVQSNNPVQNEESNGADSTCFIPDLRVGLEFASNEAAFEYYKKYAYLHGFGVYSNGGSSSDGKKKRVIIRCHRGRVSRSKKVKPVVEKKRVQEKTGCLASINLTFNPSKELWIISSINPEHNHELCPEFSHKIKSHRSMKFYVKKQLEINENAGLPTIGNINVVMQMGGGPDLCGFTERDVRNVIGKLRRYKMQNGDAEAMMSFFRQAKRDDPEFYYACKFSLENRLEIVFWADSMSYDLPVVSIVGINHHYQTIVLGCSMMTTEDGDSYKWILQSFLDCMGGKAPSAIVTDQSSSMKVAIQHKINSSPDNAWLTEMFDLRAKWVPAYLSKIFWAGMSSTQRSESMNAFLDMFVNSKTCLSAFVKSFDSGLARLKRNELNEDYNCIRGDPKTFTEDPIERQFLALYTHKMFYKLQAELLDAKAIAVKINERRQAYDSTYMLLYSTFLELIDYALLDDTTLKAVADGLNALRSTIANSRERMIEGVGNSGSNEGSHTDSNVMGLNGNENQAVVQDPVCKRRRGRNPAKRMQGVAEKIHKKIVKKKKLEEAEAKIGTDARCSRVKTNSKFKKACFSNKRDTSTNDAAN